MGNVFKILKEGTFLKGEKCNFPFLALPIVFSNRWNKLVDTVINNVGNKIKICIFKTSENKHKFNI